MGSSKTKLALPRCIVLILPYITPYPPVMGSTGSGNREESDLPLSGKDPNKLNSSTISFTTLMLEMIFE